MVTLNSVELLKNPTSNTHIFLRGRPPLGEYLDFVASEAIDGDQIDRRPLANDWRKANDRIVQLEMTEAGIANDRMVDPLPAELALHESTLLADPMLKKTFSIVPISIGMVDLDTMIVFQKHINLSHVARIQEALGAEPTLDAIFRCCLPFDHPQPPVEMRRIAPNVFAFVSPSEDLRFLEATLLQPTQVPTYTPSGPPAGIIGLVVGFGTNFLNAIHVDGRLILNNGSHRAYALRDLGIAKVPCLVQHVTRHEELDALTNALGPDSDVYLKGARPPILRDYFDPELTTSVSLPRKNRQVRVAFQVEQLDAPAL